MKKCRWFEFCGEYALPGNDDPVKGRVKNLCATHQDEADQEARVLMVEFLQYDLGKTPAEVREFFARTHFAGGS